MTDLAALEAEFWKIVELVPAEQARRLAALEAGDPQLARRLGALIAADARGESLQRIFQPAAIAAERPARIGAYEVTGVLGVGGMGEVYRARDVRLNREVAIKVLPVALASDRERLARFEREAQVLASLNHPHIAQLYGLDDSGGTPALVMELVEGPTLDTVVAGEPGTAVDIVRALELARQIADALDAAHEKGIIHRDLKPGNVALTPKGDVKILDFGVAKSLGTSSSEGAAALMATDIGIVLGTPAYMSPEQARGLVVDKRTDVWAFGCLLYELLTRQRPFVGITPTDTLAAALTRDPDMTILPAGTPHVVRWLLGRCLEKDPTRRLPDIAGARDAIDDALHQRVHQAAEALAIGDQPAAAPMGSPSRDSRWRPVRAAAWTLAAAAVVLAVTGRALWISRAASVHSLRTSPMTLVPLTTLSGDEYSPAFSPDGEQIAFTWNGEHEDNFDLYVRPVGSGALRRLTVDAGFDGDPAWSPEGKRIAFVRWGVDGTGRVYVIDPLGGSERGVGELAISAADPAQYSRISWSPNPDYIAAAGTPPASAGSKAVPGIYLLPVGGGELHLVVPAPDPMMHYSPAFSRDGHRMAYASCSGENWCDVFIIDLDSRLMPTAPPRRVTHQEYSMIGKVAWSADSHSIVYDAEVVPLSAHLWRVAADGASAPERFEAAGFARLPAIAATGDRAAFTQWRFDVDIFRFESGGPPQAVLTSTSLDMNPRFSPDGRRIAFGSGRTAERLEIWVADRDGRDAHQLTNGPGIWQIGPSWSPDGGQLVFESVQREGHHLWVIDANGAGLRRLPGAAGDQRRPTWSRDGRWIYFTSEDGPMRSVCRMPAGGGPITRLARSTGEVVWESRDGSRVFYSIGDVVWSSPTGGGAPRKEITCAKGGAIALGASGIYYAACNFTFEVNTMLHVMNPDTHQDRLIGPLTDYWFDLEVSPDEKTILYDKVMHRGQHKRLSVGSDLMLIEHFR